MADFKDYIQKDLDVFFNTDEFASKHIINDKEMNIIIDDDLLKERKLKSAEGTFIGDILFSVRKSEFGNRPYNEEVIIFDGSTYRVTDSQEEDGMYIIEMEKRMS